ncbi:MAG: CDP-alcohol phosphatidyltransferase family protein [Myxococcales bacterium]
MNPSQSGEANPTAQAPEASGAAPAAPSKYDYTCIENSILYPHLKRWLWAPAVPALLPMSLSPNTMTIIGNLLAWISFFILLSMNPEHRLLFLVPAILNFVSLSLDNMDGIQARRTGRSSPLGEYLDHWADSFIATMMVFGYGISTGLEPWIMLTAMAMVGTAYFATFWEQRHSRRLVFGLCGSIEAIIAISAFYCAYAFIGLEPLAKTPRVFGYSIASSIFAVVGFFSATAFVGSMIRVGKRWGDFVPHLLVFGAGGLWYAYGEVPLIAVGFIYMLSSAHLGGRMVMAKVLDEEPRIGDTVLYLLLGAAIVASWALKLGPTGQTIAAVPVVAYLLARLAGDFHRTVGSLREHLNPSELLSLLVPRT